MHQRTEQVQHELCNLASTAALRDPTPTLVKEINARQQELDNFAGQLFSTEPDSISTDSERIRQFATTALGDIRRPLKVDVQKA
jgi:hypothetical protein